MIAGRYTLDREIGRGGMGAVHLARDEVLGREVAVKRIGLSPGTDGPDLARAEREARVAAQLSHPHAVAIFDLVEDDGQHWLVMEYVEGESLSHRVAESGPLPPHQAARVCAEVAEALTVAHAAGIVHRDVKPSNILLTPAGQAKLADFGIARSSSEATLTQTGLVTGSPAYLAPEAAAGAEADAAADVWSLGATLFHLLSGRPPYLIGENIIGGLYKIVHEEPARLAEPGPFGEVLDGAMNKDVSRRWTMAQMRDELHEIADDPSVDAVSPQVATAATPMPEPPAHQTQTLAASPAPPPPGRPPVQTSTHRREGVLPWLVAGAAVLLLVVLGAIYLLGQEETPSGDVVADPPSTSTSSAKTSAANDTRQTRRAIEDFVKTYLSTVTSDPQQTFEMLSPGFQAASGGFEDYSSFWGKVRSASLVSVDADPDALTVSYTVRYVFENGSESTQDVMLRLVSEGNDFLIDGEAGA